MYGYGHEHGTRTQTATQSSWYASSEAANIQAVEDTERALVTALATQVGNAVAAMPEAATRIAKAATLVQAKDVWTLNDGSFLVGSQSDTELAYLVVRHPAWVCDCADFRAHKHLCKHILSVCLVLRVGDAYKPVYN